MMHDCALTQNYVLLVDVPLVFDPKVGLPAGRRARVHPGCCCRGQPGSSPVSAWQGAATRMLLVEVGAG